MPDLVTLAEAKEALNIRTTASDAELAAFIGAVTPIIEDHAGAVAVRQFTETLVGPVLRHSPVLSVDSVTVNGSAFTGYTTTHLEAGLLYGAPAGATVTYTVGRNPVPEAIKRAALVVLRELWSTQRGAQPLPATGEGEGGFTPRGSSDLPPLAQLLLKPYRRGTAVA